MIGAREEDEHRNISRHFILDDGVRECGAAELEREEALR